MTKPIIIDGVDVSECEQLASTKSGKYYCYDYSDGFCEDYKDCIYKQLQRLKAENDELKKEYKHNLSICKVCIYSSEYLDDCINGNCKDGHEEFKKLIESNKRLIKMSKRFKYTKNANKKYKQALEEVRKYCQKCKNCVETGDEVILYTIIKKVNEVLKDE